MSSRAAIDNAARGISMSVAGIIVRGWSTAAIKRVSCAVVVDADHPTVVADVGIVVTSSA